MPRVKQPVDPISGLTITKSGELTQSTGSGSNQTQRIIPPADMANLVKLGIAPCEIPNWNQADPDSAYNLRYRKFTPERKQIFLAKLEQHGRVMLAARHAGIHHGTASEHRKLDPEFDQACKDAEAMYHEMCVASIVHQARVGQTDERWDSKGNLLSRRVSYESKLREMIVKRADPSYNDVSRQEVAVVGGAVVVPAPVDSVESWDAIVARHTGVASSPAILTGGTETVITEALPSEAGRGAKRAVESSASEPNGGTAGGSAAPSGHSSEEPATE